MPDRATPAEGDLSPPVVAVDVGSSVPFGDAGTPQNHAGSGWISPFRVGLAIVLLVAALVGWQLTRSSSPTYRTAVIGTGTVVATLTSVGTITPVDQAKLNFNVSGTVSAVDVSVGQAVTTGQTLASLDIADLNATAVSGQATLASATATLASAEASETVTAPSSTPASASAVSPTTTTTVPASGPGQSSQADQRITQLQAELVADQMQEDADSAQAALTLKEATALCEATVSATVPDTSTTTRPASTTSPASTASTPGPPTTTPGPGGTGAPTSCSEALTLASSAQAEVAADIKKVDQSESALTSVLESSSRSSGGSSGGSPSSGSPSGGSPSSGSPSGGSPSSGSPSGGSSSGSPSGGSPSSGSTFGTGGSTSTATTTPSAGSGETAGATLAGTGSEAPAKASNAGGSTTAKATPQQLAVDQASIDTAQANLADAQQALSGANLVSTITGTVGSVSIAAGDSVTAGSASGTAQIVVIGTGSSYDVTTDVDVADIGKVAVGQKVRVTPDSTNTELVGKVESVGVLASTGSTTTTYPVTISLTSPDLGQLSGADASLAIIIRRSVGVTTVPSSAIRTVGAIHLVTVVENNKAKGVRVTVGTVGPVLTQVTSGVFAGQVVSLADLNQPLPSTSTGTRTAFGAGLGGAGLGAGGFGGARFGGGGGGFSARLGG